MSSPATDRRGVWPLVGTVLAAAAPLTVVAGGATAGFAVTGITGIPLGSLVVAAVPAVSSLGYVAMAERSRRLVPPVRARPAGGSLVRAVPASG